MKLQKQLGLTWHHVDDLDINLKIKIQLVTINAHRVTLTHTGSHKQLEEIYNALDRL